MQIQSVKQTSATTTVLATLDGNQAFEYTSHNAGPWEVYDHPKAWRGVPRFLGYLPEETGHKHGVELARGGWVRR